MTDKTKADSTVPTEIEMQFQQSMELPHPNPTVSVDYFREPSHGVLLGGQAFFSAHFSTAGLKCNNANHNPS